MMREKRAKLQDEAAARLQHSRARDAESFRRSQIEADERDARKGIKS
jgi:hypothetical protein